MTFSFATEQAVLSPTARIVVQGGGGADIAVQHWARADGPAILFLHAFGTNHIAWAKQLTSDLADRFSLVTMDHRGHGDSGKPAEASAYADGALFATDIKAVIDSIGADKIHIVAWSMSGGLFGDYLALHGGDRIASVTLIDAVNALGAPMFGSGQIGATMADESANLIHSPHLLDQIAGFNHVNGALTSEPVDADTAATILASSMQLPVAARSAILMRDADHLAAYAALAAPIQAIHADDDTIVTLAAPERLQAERSDVEIIRFADGGHAPHWQHATAANAAIARLVDAAVSEVTNEENDHV